MYTENEGDSLFYFCLEKQLSVPSTKVSLSVCDQKTRFRVNVTIFHFIHNTLSSHLLNLNFYSCDLLDLGHPITIKLIVLFKQGIHNLLKTQNHQSRYHRHMFSLDVRSLYFSRQHVLFPSCVSRRTDFDLFILRILTFILLPFHTPFSLQ